MAMAEFYTIDQCIQKAGSKFKGIPIFIYQVGIPKSKEKQKLPSFLFKITTKFYSMETIFSHLLSFVQ